LRARCWWIRTFPSPSRTGPQNIGCGGDPSPPHPDKIHKNNNKNIINIGTLRAGYGAV
jgi:hypothetical protein